MRGEIYGFIVRSLMEGNRGNGGLMAFWVVGFLMVGCVVFVSGYEREELWMNGDR